MKKIYLILFLFMTAFLFKHELYAQTQGTELFRQEGIASWYGREFDGRPTASGEIYDSSQLTAAHPNLPFGTVLTVTNKHNNRRVTVRVNDRGPFVAARIIDVSRAAAEQLDMIVTGTAPVVIESIERIAVSAPAAESSVGSISTSEPPPSVTQSLVPTQAPTLPPVYQSSTQTQTPASGQINVTAPGQTISTGQATVTASGQTAAVQAQTPASTGTQQSSVIGASNQIRLIPDITIAQNKQYRLQVGSFKVARNAVDTFERLKNAGLNPAYERFTDSSGEFFRVVLAGVRGNDVQSTAQKLWAIGFREAIIREE